MWRRLILLFTGLFVCVAPAQAEWVPAGSDDFSKIYFDPASVRKNADGSTNLRALTDYNPASPQAEPFKLSEKGRSEIEQVVFDCAKDAYRSEGGVWYEGPMATGSMRLAYPAKIVWGKVPSFYATLFGKTCASR